MDTLYIVLIGTLMGLSIAAPPGPINAMMAHESLESPLHGTSVGAGAMTADFIFFLLTFFFKSLIPSKYLFIFYLVGGVYMLYLAYGVWKAKVMNVTVKGSYIKGLTTAIVNPYQIGWWLTFGISMLDQFSVYIAPGFFLGILIWIFLFPAVISRFGKNYVLYVKLFSLIVLVFFGVYFLYQGALYAIKV
ncbi:LysE family transporter [Stygiolobus caldivivus]|uniref:Lysine transporter LysE n=1 Tax=Stygiolobus caldivivus TaxID=2824673 RepID=A0A8D5U7H7_9CREN|nr:LysE family transporter [Stygiolobus caldivivus]BCU70759.1 lysine transporter LysE [Stygiolobus caldivivus]